MSLYNYATKKKLLQLKVFNDDECLDKYCELIESNKNTKREKFKTQKHHIIPKSVFTTLHLTIDNSRENLVNLSYKDHILAHYYLCKCTKNNIIKYKMILCINLITKGYKIHNSSLENSFIEFRDNLEDFQKLYEEALKIKASMRKGKIIVHHPNLPYSFIYINIDELDNYLNIGYIKGRSTELNKKIGVSQRGKIITTEQKSKFRDAKLGKIKIYLGDIGKLIEEKDLAFYLNNGWKLGVSLKTRENISKGSFGKRGTFEGKTHPLISRQKIGTANSGGKYIFRKVDGVIETLHIKLDELQSYLDSGWKVGNPKARKPKGVCCWVNNGTQNKYIDKKDLNMFINQGFRRGRINKKVNLC